MAVFRVKKDKENPYVMLNKEFLNDDKLSWKAKGVLAYLLSLPDDWQIYESEVVKHSKDGKDSLKSAIKELMANGYLEREQIRDERGCFKGYDYVVNESSNRSGFSNNGRGDNGESATTNNNETNNNKTNIISMCDKVSKKDVDTVIERYKTIEGVEQHRAYEEVRRKAIRDKIKKYGLDTVMEVLDKVEQSTFLTTGKNKKTNIDFIFKQKNKKSGVSNFIEILENKYKDKNSTSKQPKTSYNTNNMLG